MYVTLNIVSHINTLSPSPSSTLNIGIFVNSSCSCPGSDHPGPSVTQGRGAPEIDIFEAEKDKVNPTGQVASQSAQFAPFTHDYVYLNDTADEWTIYNTSMTVPNSYRGSAVYVPFFFILLFVLVLNVRVSGNRQYRVSRSFLQICFKALQINDLLKWVCSRFFSSAIGRS
jgi:Beta-glucan synthesis-associated protein SKN1/KRE6/Sbg1